MTETVQDATPRTRRSLLAAAAGGAAALAVSAVRPAAVAAAPTNMQTETNNVATAPTSLSNTDADETAFIVQASAGGTALQANSGTGVAVFGRSADTSDPETNDRNAGLVGVAGDDTAIADNIALTGVYGFSDPSSVEGFVGAGVWGDSADWGVIGSGSGGVLGDGLIGVLGTTLDPGGFGVFATVDEPDAISLAVDGRAVFSRSGRATVNAGKNKEVVNLPGCTANTLVIAVLAQNRDGRYVRAAVPEAGKFTIYLNRNVPNNTRVSWIAFTDPATLSG